MGEIGPGFEVEARAAGSFLRRRFSRWGANLRAGPVMKATRSRMCTISDGVVEAYRP